MAGGANSTLMSIFGETLRQARAHKGVTVKEAEQATRINRLHLAALEEENFNALPPLIYQRGIVRNYAVYLALDPGKLLTMFDEARGGVVAPISVVPSTPPVDMPRQWVPNFAVIAFLVVMSAVVFAWFYSAYFAPGGPEPTATAPVPSVTPLPSDDPAGLEAWSMVPTLPAKPTEAATPKPSNETESTPGAAADAASDEGNSEERSARSSPPPEPEPEEVSAPEAEADTPPVAAAEEPVETMVEEPVMEEPVVEETAPPSGDLTQLSFSPTADITLSVIGDGVVLYEGYLGAGQVVGPFEAVSFEIYTSDVNDTSITNHATGQTFVVSYDEGEQSFRLP